MKKKLLLSTLFVFVLACQQESNTVSNLQQTEVISANSIKPYPKMNKAAQVRKKEAEELRIAYSKPSSQWPKPELDLGTPENVEFKEIGSLPAVKFPETNKFSSDRASLGRELFFDTKLSSSNKLACATCHIPELSWADGKKTPTGHEDIELKRNSPTVVNAAYNTVQFWDGRVKTLEEQATAVITNPNELHSTPESVAETFNKIPAYKKKFKTAYNIDKITIDDISKAIATFERTVTTKNQSPFDQFLAGKKEALSDAQVRGLHVFRTKGRCLNCHTGANFTDNKYHNLGMTSMGTDFEDLGRFNVTKDSKDIGRFKTPSIRNVVNTAPYMHRGNLKMTRVIEQYNHGFQGESNISPLIKALNLYEEEAQDLEAFLHALSEATPK